MLLALLFTIEKKKKNNGHTLPASCVDCGCGSE
jgi:hypothetical protein